VDVLYDVGRMGSVVDSQHLANIHSQSQEVFYQPAVQLMGMEMELITSTQV
jgi:hypothetical protein